MVDVSAVWWYRRDMAAAADLTSAERKTVAALVTLVGQRVTGGTGRVVAINESIRNMERCGAVITPTMRNAALMQIVRAR